MTAVLAAMIIALGVAFTGLLAYLVPWSALAARLLERCWPDEGRHSPHAVTAPAPPPAQAPRPADPPREARGAVRAGATPGAGAPPAPAAAPPVRPPADESAAAAPAPSPAPPGPGRHPFRAVTSVPFPDGQVAELMPDGQWRIRGLERGPRARETGGMPALVRGGYAAHEAWRDQAVNA